MIDMPPIREDRVEPYMPPPTGTSTIADFKILAHVTLKVPRKSESKKKIAQSLE